MDKQHYNKGEGIAYFGLQPDSKTEINKIFKQLDWQPGIIALLIHISYYDVYTY